MSVKQPIPRYEHDRRIWNDCARTYEERIVNGHPDVAAYEGFEHSLIESLILHLTRDCGRSLHVYDFGCGSGRFHRALAPWIRAEQCDERNGVLTAGPDTGYIDHIGGVDFSCDMIELAQSKLQKAGLDHLYPRHLSFDVGSAFDVPPYDGPHVPLAVSVCNSIGVMQGPEGARHLFRAMRRFVEAQKGIALISCYRREAIRDYALSNYESTLDVSGQPRWLEPAPKRGADHRLVARRYKRARDTDRGITVDVYDRAGNSISTGLRLHRNEKAVDAVAASGAIDTWGDYHSRWYSTAQITRWMDELWNGADLWHCEGAALDVLRGTPAQIAVADFSGTFCALVRRWGLHPH